LQGTEWASPFLFQLEYPAPFSHNAPMLAQIQKLKERPTSVKIAVGCSVAIIVIALTGLLTQRPSILHFTLINIAAFIFTFCFFSFLALMIYRRRNWARWIYSVYTVFWLVWFVITIPIRMDMPLVRFITQVVEFILSTCAVIMLFVPAANNWFKKPKEYKR